MKNKSNFYRLLGYNFIVFSLIMLLAPFYPWWIFSVIGVCLLFISKHN